MVLSLVLHALNEDNEKCTEKKENTLRLLAIQEILTTEVTYLQQLEILAKVSFNIFFIIMTQFNYKIIILFEKYYTD